MEYEKINWWEKEVRKMYYFSNFKEDNNHKAKLVSQLEEIARGHDFGLGIAPNRSHAYKPDLLQLIQKAVYANAHVDASGKKEFIHYSLELWTAAKSDCIISSWKKKKQKGKDSLTDGVAEAERFIEKIRITERVMKWMNDDNVWRIMAQNRQYFENVMQNHIGILYSSAGPRVP